MKKVIATLCMVTLTVGLLAGCGKKEDKQPNDTEVMVTEEETDEESREGMARSYLTGEWIDEDLADRKPVAIMIGNTNDALPQYGVSRADVVYEVPAEGGITRLMPIFQDYSDIDKIGSVRSFAIIMHIMQWSLKRCICIVDRQVMQKNFLAAAKLKI